MRIQSLLISLIIVVSLFGAIPVSACGCGVLITSSDSGDWAYGDDSSEQSFIHLENGTEKLIINLDIKNTAKDAVLVVPVPATPNSVKADILSETPKFYGYDVLEQAQKELSGIRNSLLMTQIYPLVPMGIYSFSISTLGDAAQTDGTTKSNAIEQDVVVYQHLEKAGMIAEVLSAANSDSLYQYLTQKGLKVEKDSIPIFRDYINEDFSFVVSWINPAVADVSAESLLMTFPAEKIFYPLKPGSAYSGPGMDKTITVVGHVSPELYPDIKNSTRVHYFYSPDGASLKDFFSSDAGFGFTKITINAEPQKLTQDLYISENAPLKILSAQFVNLHPFIFGVFLLIIISFASTYLVLRFFFPSASIKSNFIGLGIANCLTIIGTIIGARFFLKEKYLRFVVSSSLSFVVLTFVSWFLLSALYR